MAPSCVAPDWPEGRRQGSWGLAEGLDTHLQPRLASQSWRSPALGALTQHTGNPRLSSPSSYRGGRSLAPTFLSRPRVGAPGQCENVCSSWPHVPKPVTITHMTAKHGQREPGQGSPVVTTTQT